MPEIEIRKCKIHGDTRYVRSENRFICMKCRQDKVNRRRRKVKQMAVEYKGGACIKCGYNRCIGALEFHHIDPTQKDFAISKSGNTRAWELVKLELDKCILVCSNCHKEIHEELWACSSDG